MPEDAELLVERDCQTLLIPERSDGLFLRDGVQDSNFLLHLGF